MDILSIKKDKLKINLYKDIKEKDIFTESKCRINTPKVSFLEIDSQTNLVTTKAFNEGQLIFLSNYKKFNGNTIITSNLSRNVYNLYIKHFFNYIKKNRIKIIKGRVLKYNRKRDCFYVGINGFIIAIPSKEFTSNKSLRKKILKKGQSLFNLKPISFVCTDIKNDKNMFKIDASRHKYLKTFF